MHAIQIYFIGLIIVPFIDSTNATVRIDYGNDDVIASVTRWRNGLYCLRQNLSWPVIQSSPRFSLVAIDFVKLIVTDQDDKEHASCVLYG